MMGKLREEEMYEELLNLSNTQGHANLNRYYVLLDWRKHFHV